MKIKELQPGPGEGFTGHKIKFGPGVNLIRGANGIGKTLILEYASLLGHVAVMESSRSPDSPNLQMTVVLSNADCDFLKYLHTDDARNNPAIKTLNEALDSIQLSVEKLNAISISSREIVLSFYWLAHRTQLKAALADEEQIRAEVSVSGVADEIRIVQALNLWSRPRKIVPSPKENPTFHFWSKTPRLVDALSRSPLNASPGPVYYVNTDMYDFGTGLDLRESPKNLRRNITEVLVDRLQVVRCDLSQHELTANLSDTLKRYERDHALICEDSFREAWSKIFGDGHDFTSGTVYWNQRESEFVWTFKIDDHTDPSFVSSGENQALFLLAALQGLTSCGACMLLDEPELHLTFGAGSRLVEHIFTRAFETSSQAIIVTHHPHLYRSRIKNHKDDWSTTWPSIAFADKSKDEYNYKKFRMIYLYRGDQGSIRLASDFDAVKKASSSSQADVIEIIKGLQLDDEIPVAQWFSWLVRKLWPLFVFVGRLLTLLRTKGRRLWKKSKPE